jgi:hypothetical protein
MKMRNKLNEQLERINRLMPKIIVEDITATDETIDLDEAAPPNITFSRAFEYLETAVKGKNIDISFEKLLQKWGLIVRENGTLAPKIVYDRVTKRITKINWDRFTPQDLENFFKLQPFREAFEEQFIKTNRINIQQLQTDQVARDFLKNVNLKFFTAVETYINQTANIIDKSAADNIANTVTNYVKELFSSVWYKGFVNWYNENIGSKRFVQIIKSNLSSNELVTIREEGETLLQQYNEYLKNEGGKTPIFTADYEQKIYNYLVKLNTYTKDASKRIWNELMKDMEPEVRKQFFGTVSATGKVDPVFTIGKLNQMINYFEKLNPEFATEWTGWFQGIGRMIGDLFSFNLSRKVTFFRRLANMFIAFESRISKELVDNIEVKGNSLKRAFLREAVTRISVMYFIYPAIISAREVAKLQYIQSKGHSPYLKLGWDQYYAFMITFEPNIKEDKKEWLKVGQEGAALGIWLKLFKKYYGLEYDKTYLWNAFWRSPAYKYIMDYVNDPKTSQDNEGATTTKAEQLIQEARLKYHEELRNLLYTDPRYKDIDNKDSLWDLSMKHFEDSIVQSMTDTKKIINQGDVEVED